MDSDEDEMILCNINFEPLNNAVITNCGHSFNESAIKQWLKHNRLCPICRKVIRECELLPNFALRQACEGFSKYRESHRETIEQLEQEKKHIIVELKARKERVGILTSELETREEQLHCVTANLEKKEEQLEEIATKLIEKEQQIFSKDEEIAGIDADFQRFRFEKADSDVNMLFELKQAQAKLRDFNTSSSGPGLFYFLRIQSRMATLLSKLSSTRKDHPLPRLSHRLGDFDSRIYQGITVNGGKVAVKQIPHTPSPLSFREPHFLQSLSHPNIIPLKDLYSTPDHLFLVFPYWKTDLDFLLRKGRTIRRGIHLNLINQWMTKLLSAVAYLHIPDIIHTNISPSSILLSADPFSSSEAHCPDLCLTGFSKARVCESELRKGDDMWACGKILVSLLSCHPFPPVPIKPNDFSDLFKHYSDQLSKDQVTFYSTFLRKCFRDQKQRISAKEALAMFQGTPSFPTNVFTKRDFEDAVVNEFSHLFKNIQT